MTPDGVICHYTLIFFFGPLTCAFQTYRNKTNHSKKHATKKKKITDVGGFTCECFTRLGPIVYLPAPGPPHSLFLKEPAHSVSLLSLIATERVKRSTDRRGAQLFFFIRLIDVFSGNSCLVSDDEPRAGGPLLPLRTRPGDRAEANLGATQL